MSHFVHWRGGLFPRSLFEPLDDLPSNYCPWCGGMGVVPIEIDEERYDVAVSCPQCHGSGLQEKPAKECHE